MKKNILSITIIITLVFFTLEILTSSQVVLDSVRFSFSIWENNIFPSLFPFFIISELLINYGFVELVSELFKPFMNKIFKCNSNCAFIFIMSLISGFPSNSKYTKELYNNGLINEFEATKILMFTHFSNPLFILGTLSLFLNNKKVGLFILITHYIGNIIIGIIFRNYHSSNYKKDKISFKYAINKMTEKRTKNNLNFGIVITNSIINTLKTLFLILGTVTIFLVITTIIDNNTNLNSLNQSIVNGLFEMTQGLKYISLLNAPLKTKCVLSVMIISFGGLSVHMQVASIISDTKIKYTPFLISRIIHACISSFLAYILFDIWFVL